jgi:hypothetical protein
MLTFGVWEFFFTRFYAELSHSELKLKKNYTQKLYADTLCFQIMSQIQRVF